MLAVLALLWVLGIAQFSHALDPTGSQKDRVDLPFRNARLDGSGNWLTAGSLQGIRVTQQGIAVKDPPGGTILYSRRVAVFPHDCYSLTVRGASPGRGVRVQVVADDHVTPLSGIVHLAPVTSTIHLTFTPKGGHGVMVVFSNTGPARGFLSNAELRRIAC